MRTQAIALLMAVCGIVVIYFLAQRFIHPPGSISRPFQTLSGSTVSSLPGAFADIASDASSETSTEQESSAAPSTLLSDVSAQFGQMNLPSGAKYKSEATYIFEPPATETSWPALMVRVDGTLTFQGKEITVHGFFEPSSNVTADQLQSLFPGAKRMEANTDFGMGSELDLFQNPTTDVDPFTTQQGLQGRKFIMDWGSGISSDIASYLLPQVPLQQFNRVLIDFVDVWPGTDLPSTLNTKFINDLTASNDTHAQPYSMLDQLIQSLQF